MTKQADFKARVRARMARTGESYATARAHLLATRPLPALHVTNGDATVPGLRGTGLAERIMPWRDGLHEGPVPDVPDAELRAIRAGYLDVSPAVIEERDRTLEEHRHGEYVLWFEADLYDQLQVVQILARLHALDVPPERITLICVGEHLGIAHFGGLGELTSEQLARLPATAATTLTTAALEYATRAWAALRAPDPGGLGGIVATPSPELRFVAEAYDRLSREYPSTRDGLSLTERRLLAAVADGAQTDGDAFVRAARPRGAAVPGRHVGVRSPDSDEDRGDAAAGGRRAAAPHRGGPRGARRPPRPRRPQRHRPLDRRRAPHRHRRPVALGRGHRVDHRASWKMTPSAVRLPRVTVEMPCRMPTRW